MDEAAKVGDIFITATGVKDILVGRHFDSMKDGAVFCNTGHYDCEINIGDLDTIASSKRTIRDNNEEYDLGDGRKVYLLAQGRLVNLSAAEGHPSEVMDMSFANQFLAPAGSATSGVDWSQATNIGMVSNFNSCVQRARGQWVHILHDDDLVLPGFYAAYKELVLAHSDVAMAIGRVVITDELERWTGLYGPLPCDESGLLEDFLERQTFEQLGQCAGIVVKREKIGTAA